MTQDMTLLADEWRHVTSTLTSLDAELQLSLEQLDQLQAQQLVFSQWLEVTEVKVKADAASPESQTAQQTQATFEVWSYIVHVLFFSNDIMLSKSTSI